MSKAKLIMCIVKHCYGNCVGKIPAYISFEHVPVKFLHKNFYMEKMRNSSMLEYQHVPVKFLHKILL